VAILPIFFCSLLAAYYHTSVCLATKISLLGIPSKLLTGDRIRIEIMETEKVKVGFFAPKVGFSGIRRENMETEKVSSAVESSFLRRRSAFRAEKLTFSRKVPFEHSTELTEY
jgi:hypothetical protein